MADVAGFFLRERELHHGALRDLPPGLRRVDEVDHADVEIVGAEIPHQMLEGQLHLVGTAGAFILALFPDCAEMRLQHEALAPVLHGVGHKAVHGGIGTVKIHAVDAVFERQLKQRTGVLAVFAVESLTAKSDLADRQIRFPQCSVIHTPSSFPLPGRRQSVFLIIIHFFLRVHFRLRLQIQLIAISRITDYNKTKLMFF